ncbi:hypothetical protein BH11PSE11_BH11PSE11_26170 [soil metagenome]
MYLFVSILVACVFFAVGFKTIVEKRSKVLLQLWNFRGSNEAPNRHGGAYSESEHTGMVAVLIGVFEIAVGVGILFNSFGS